MEPNNPNKIKELQKMDKSDLIYLSVIILLFIIIGFIFAHSTGFIVKNINKIFSTNTETVTQTLDMNKYSLLEKKLSLPKNAKEAAEPKSDTQEKATDITTVETIDENKKSTSIRIIDITTTGNNANLIQEELKKVGFEKISIQKRKNAQAASTILIKDSKKGYTKEIENILTKYYPKVTFEGNAETSIYDIIIVIGN